MHHLYEVKSKYYLPQLKADFEYHWFVYRRATSHNLDQANQSGKTRLVSNYLNQQVVDEFFTLEEAFQLETLLQKLYSNLGSNFETSIWLEEAAPGAGSGQELCPLSDIYQATGHFVDPYDFASFEGYDLKVLVAARVTSQPRYLADDFLSKLSAVRLAALRQMHAHCNG
jgi:hypothetical protein